MKMILFMHEWATYSVHSTRHFHLMRATPPNQSQCHKHLLHIYLLKCLMNIWKAFSNHKTSLKLSPSFLLWIINHILKRLLQFLHLLSSYGEWVRKQFAWWRPVQAERERKKGFWQPWLDPGKTIMLTVFLCAACFSIWVLYSFWAIAIPTTENA